MNLLKLITDHIPVEFVREALECVAGAAINIGENDKRREFCVTVLQRSLHIPEHLARLLVELAVLHLKTASSKPAAPTTADGD